MKHFATMFCHVFEPDAQIELQRQHDQLTQYASQKGLPIEHCFFHVGSFDFEKPDDVLLSFLRSAQQDDLGLVLIESVSLFPIPQQEQIPQMEVFFTKEGLHQTIGNEDVEIAIDDSQPIVPYMYWGR